MDDLDGTSFFGTVQPQSASEVKAKDRNAVLPVFLQEARDEKGRKRLHGAFTGGFSAGYYNTVGSKEGWQPSTFQSSRAARGKFEQKAEDFMDEEDLAEISNARKVTATQDFDILGGTKRELERKAAVTNAIEKTDGSIAGRIVQDLIIPASDPIGVRLLRKMGWRDGQGVGPRMKRKFKDTADEEDDIHAQGHLFAPQDITAVILTGRFGTFGVGYDRFKGAEVFRGGAEHGGSGRGGAGDDDDDDDEAGGEFGKNRSAILGIGKKRKKEVSEFGVKGGFGTGVFEDDDDEEVYTAVKKPNMNFSIVDDDDDDIGPFGGRNSLHKMNSSKMRPILQKNRFDNSGVGIGCTGFDGKPALPGFHVASFRVTLSVWFDAPKPPADFIPKFRLAAERAAAVSTPYPLIAKNQDTLTADQRRVILGEDELKGPTRSVFSFISRKNQDRLQSLIDAKILGKDPAAAAKKKEEAPLPTEILVEKETALAALKGFLPFTTDEAKQERYKRFLEVKAGISDIQMKHPPHFTPRELAHELLEFSKSAHMYKPLSNMMASRFTSSTSSEKPEELKPKERIYGSATRTKIEFKPHKLLCKRFNITNPYPEPKSSAAVGTNGPKVLTEEDLQKEILNSEKMNELKSFIIGSGREGDGEEGEGSGNYATVTNISLSADAGDVVEPVVDEPKRPAMDIFKAIFADSDDDSSDESSSEDEDDKKNPPQQPAVKPAAPAKPSSPLKSMPPPISSPEKPMAFVSNSTRATGLPPPTFRPIFSRKQDRKKEVETVVPIEVEPTPPSIAPSTTSPTTTAIIPQTSLPETNKKETEGEEDGEPVIIIAPRPLVAASWATSLLAKKPPPPVASSTTSSTEKRKRASESGDDDDGSSSSEESRGESRRKSSSSRKHSKSSSDKDKKKRKEGKEKKRKKEKSSSSKKKKPSSGHRDEDQGEWVEASASVTGEKRHGDGYRDSERRDRDKGKERERVPERKSNHNRPRASDFF
ncbi:UNVERIFIED_CONTAM: hypothetical protein HDU68_007543 [Siphonaria sp. JEL0065]|nr:hypothetical protein HDU68_007543 [Siphonaria sp. JEL0065]